MPKLLVMEYVLYLRASTQRQGLSGLGLEGQRLIAHRFLQPGDRILSEYIEVESGRKNNRPEMAKAIVETRSASATLLVAEMSRLARSVYFTSKLMEEKVRFKACDIPHADEFTINILAAVAQKAAKDISESTKRGLAVVQRNAQEHVANKQARRLAVLLRRDGLTLAAIADELNTHGYRTRRGQLFRKSTVYRLLPPAQPVASESVAA